METSSTIIRSYGRLPPELRIAIWTAADADDEVLAIFLSRRGRGGRQVRVVCSHPHRIIGRWSRPQYMLYHHDELCLRGPAPFVSFAADIFNFVEGNLTETLDLGVRCDHMRRIMLPGVASSPDLRWVHYDSACMELFLLVAGWPACQPPPPPSEFVVHRRPPHHGDDGCICSGASLVCFLPVVERGLSAWELTVHNSVQYVGSFEAFRRSDYPLYRLVRDQLA
ncbi:hypothetical protein GE09DRAFT_472756 [Coniochaeta sp. 2T2.1]|nr:hypothetical protein GE09DRAFT_472756 [Coniochaeta sp. 2T2.1]